MTTRTLPTGHVITVRDDVLSPWFDVSYKGDHWASFKTLSDAYDYALESETAEPTWSCGCTDYHYADCPTRGRA